MKTPTGTAYRSGFTFIELILAIAIVGVLSAIALPAYNNYREKALITRCIADIRMIELEIKDYVARNSRYPDGDDLSVLGHPPLNDPWGHPYQYLNIADDPGKGKGKYRKDRFLVPLNSDYDLYSMGPDGKTVPPLTAKASEDDIVRANDGQYVGVAEDY